MLPMLVIALLQSCAGPRKIKLPPVTEGWQQSKPIKNGYLVQKNDSLYSIAWSFGLDYRDLASINKLHPPYKLLPGQHLLLKSPRALRKKSNSIAISTTPAPNVPSHWQWPTKGKLASTFNNYKAQKNQGIDIVGNFGQAIFSCNKGTVVYSGTGIKSYGKLIIIKHNEDYLSAYAHNKEILAFEGDHVRAGQQIATMGNNREGKSMLHFEIRLLGKPVDPLNYLPKK